MCADEKQTSLVSALLAGNMLACGTDCKRGFRETKQPLILSPSKDPISRSKVLNVVASPFWPVKSIANAACQIDEISAHNVADNFPAVVNEYQPSCCAGGVEVPQAPPLEGAVVQHLPTAVPVPQQASQEDPSQMLKPLSFFTPPTLARILLLYHHWITS